MQAQPLLGRPGCSAPLPGAPGSRAWLGCGYTPGRLTPWKRPGSCLTLRSPCGSLPGRRVQLVGGHTQCLAPGHSPSFRQPLSQDLQEEIHEAVSAEAPRGRRQPGNSGPTWLEQSFSGTAGSTQRRPLAGLCPRWAAADCARWARLRAASAADSERLAGSCSVLTFLCATLHPGPESRGKQGGGRAPWSSGGKALCGGRLGSSANPRLSCLGYQAPRVPTGVCPTGRLAPWAARQLPPCVATSSPPSRGVCELVQGLPLPCLTRTAPAQEQTPW